MVLFYSKSRRKCKGHSRLLKRGTAIKRRRNFPSVEGTKRGLVPLDMGFGVLPQENFLIQDVCRSDSNEFRGHFSFENRLILQALAVFQNLEPLYQCINKKP